VIVQIENDLSLQATSKGPAMFLVSHLQ